MAPAFEQQQRLTGIILRNTFVDRGYREPKSVLGTTITLPDKPSKNRTAYEKQKLIKGFERRAAIEPKLNICNKIMWGFYRGIKGDDMNVMLGAAATNFKKMMNIYKEMFVSFFCQLMQ